MPKGYLEGQIGPEKGPKGTLFGQIWFAFSFIVLEKGSKWATVCSKVPDRPQNGPKWAKIGSKWGQNGVKMGQNRVKRAQNGIPLAPLAIWGPFIGGGGSVQRFHVLKILKILKIRF